jgi:hypothetical protein
MAANDLSEDDVSVKFITPAIVEARWEEGTQVRAQICDQLTTGILSRNTLKSCLPNALASTPSEPDEQFEQAP